MNISCKWWAAGAISVLISGLGRVNEMLDGDDIGIHGLRQSDLMTEGMGGTLLYCS